MGVDSIKQHMDYCCAIDALDKPEKSRNKIAAPKGYDSIREKTWKSVGIITLYKLVLPSTGCVHRFG